MCRCGPCQMLAPILASISTRMEGKIQVVKIDTEKYPQVASKFNVAVRHARQNSVVEEAAGSQPLMRITHGGSGTGLEATTAATAAAAAAAEAEAAE